MKTNKWLTKLTAFIAVISVMLSGVAVLPAAAEDSTATTQKYIASDYFNLESNPNNPWTWMYYLNNSDNTGHGDYQVLSMPNSDAGTIAPDSAKWQSLTGLTENYTDTRAWMHYQMYDVVIGPHLMKVSTRKITDSNKYNGAVRAFTAPQSGYVNIGAIDAMGGSKIFSPIKGSHEINHYLAINKKSADGTVSRIWPSVGNDVLLTNDQKSVNFAPLLTYVEKGDVLYFEAYLGGQTKNASWCIQPVYWNPYVEYVSKFVASDYFSTTSNPNSPWSWMYYKNNGDNTGHGDYQLLNTYNESAGTLELFANSWTGITGIETVYNDYRAWSHGDMYETLIGPHLIKVSTRAIDDTKKFNGAVRAFTAPATGYVTVGAIDAMGGSKIFSPIKGDHEINHYLAINKRSADGTITRVWPENGTEVLLTNSKKSVTFTPISVYLERGDTLYFEAYLGGQTKSASWCIQPVYWNPYVEYESTRISGISFTDNSGAALKNFDSIVTAGSANVSVSLQNIDTVIGNAVAVACIYDTNGILRSAGTSASVVIPKTGEATFSIPNLNTSVGVNTGYIKLFLFNNFSSLQPITDIGLQTYIAKLQ